jgi:hypothetical protein
MVASNLTEDELQTVSQRCEHVSVLNATWSEFTECFSFYLYKELAVTTTCCTIIALTCILNLKAIIILRHRQRRHTKNNTHTALTNHTNIFDKILIANSVVNFVAGTVNLLFYLVEFEFANWPLGLFVCAIHMGLESMLGTVEILHILLLSFFRIRSILSPKTYAKEFMIKNFMYTLTLLWIFSAVIWIPTVSVTTYITINSDFTCVWLI